MRFLLKIIILFFFLLFSSSNLVLAQNSSSNNALGKTQLPKNTYYKARVIKVLEEGKKDKNGLTSFYQTLEAEISDGNENGKRVRLEQGGLVNVTSQQLLKSGEDVVVLKTTLGKNTTYTLLDKYRLNNILYIILGFFALVAFIAGKKGLGAILGLFISLFVVLKFIVPQILNGHDPVGVTILGSLFIVLTTMFLAHGISKKVIVAIISTLAALVLTGFLASFFVTLTNLSGLGSEESFFLQFDPSHINMRGLLLAGIIIGALGVLDDITTTQSATVFELHHTDKNLKFIELFKKGFNVGREHIASLVNTLVLAYAGASLSLFILFVINPLNQPYWVILNSEIIIEEVIRTLAGSVGLVLAVPIATLMASWVATSAYFKKM